MRELCAAPALAPNTCSCSEVAFEVSAFCVLLFIICPNWACTEGSPGGSVAKNLPAKPKMGVLSLGQKDCLEKEMATPSSILAWQILWTEQPGELKSIR